MSGLFRPVAKSNPCTIPRSKRQRPSYRSRPHTPNLWTVPPYWRDLILFYEYFHGDNGAGLGASHQTGWTGIVARFMHLFATLTPEMVLEGGTFAGISAEDARARGPL